MAFTIYSSSDASAPTLTGVAGSLTTLLDAILVNGYGTKAAAGWTIAKTASNQRAYQLGAGTGRFLSIDDTAPTTAKEAVCVGFETVSSATAGTGAFPSSGNYYFRKSASADSTARSWICFADARTMYFFANTGDANGITYVGFRFGDFYDLSGTNTWGCFISGVYTANQTGAAVGEADPTALSGLVGTAMSGMSIDRTFGGGGTSVAASQHGDFAKGNNITTNPGSMGYSGVQTPNGADNAIYVSPIWIVETATATVRGRIRGFWHLCHANAGFADGQTMTGTNDVAGKTFQFVKGITLDGNVRAGGILIETSDTLETNTP